MRETRFREKGERVGPYLFFMKKRSLSRLKREAGGGSPFPPGLFAGLCRSTIFFLDLAIKKKFMLKVEFYHVFFLASHPQDIGLVLL